MVRVRRLTREGRSAFADYLQQARSNPEVPPPQTLLEDERASAPLEAELSVEQREFDSKRQAGEYFDRRLSGTEISEVRRDSGLWSWLSLFYFDQVCPPDAEGKRKVNQTEQYILIPDWRRYYRHLLMTPWELYRKYPDSARVLLSGTVDTHGDFMEQLASRQEIVTNRGVIDAADRLYYNVDEGRPKRGARSRDRPGNVRRLVEVKQQLDLTFDLYDLQADEILDLLPPEFDHWREADR